VNLLDAAFVKTIDRTHEAERAEYEKFLFYRGVAEFAPPLMVRVLESDKVQGPQFMVKNIGKGQVTGMVVVRCDGDGSMQRTAMRDLEPGTQTTFSLSCKGVRDGQELDQMMIKSLIEAGLHEKEARAMVKTWRADAQAAVASGRWPRKDFLELQRVLEADVIDYDTIRQSPLWRAIARVTGVAIVQAVVKSYEELVVNAERIKYAPQVPGVPRREFDADGVAWPGRQELYANMLAQGTVYNEMLQHLRDLCGGGLILLALVWRYVPVRKPAPGAEAMEEKPW